MAKGLATMVRLNEWYVDEKRRRLGHLLRSLGNLEQHLENLEHEVVREQGRAGAAPEEAGFLYGNYAQGVIKRREDLHAAIADMETQVAAAREEVNEAYRELKKYETVNNNRIERERLELERRDTILLDELGLEAFRRNPD